MSKGMKKSIDKWVVHDLIVYGKFITKNGKRINPEKLYKQPSSWEKFKNWFKVKTT